MPDGTQSLSQSHIHQGSVQEVRMKKSKPNVRWLAEHQQDEYVRRAKLEGYRSRASYKLLEIDDKYHVIQPAARIIDLGAAPGGWSQVAMRRAGAQGYVLALDLLSMEPLDGVQFIQGDFTASAIQDRLLECLNGKPVDLVISDMSPNLSGMKAIDQPKAMHLAELALELAGCQLRAGGSLLLKCFEGEGIDAMRAELRQHFVRLNTINPRASRDKSREIYMLGRGFTSAEALPRG